MACWNRSTRCCSISMWFANRSLFCVPSWHRTSSSRSAGSDSASGTCWIRICLVGCSRCRRHCRDEVRSCLCSPTMRWSEIVDASRACQYSRPDQDCHYLPRWAHTSLVRSTCSRCWPLPRACSRFPRDLPSLGSFLRNGSWKRSSRPMQRA